MIIVDLELTTVHSVVHIVVIHQSEVVLLLLLTVRDINVQMMMLFQRCLVGGNNTNDWFDTLHMLVLIPTLQVIAGVVTG